jgi:hypothetical protein
VCTRARRQQKREATDGQGLFLLRFPLSLTLEVQTLSKIFGNKEMRVLMLGLDNAGKQYRSFLFRSRARVKAVWWCALCCSCDRLLCGVRLFACVQSIGVNCAAAVAVHTNIALRLAGKTTILYKLKLGQGVSTIPTVSGCRLSALGVAVLVCKSCVTLLWDELGLYCVGFCDDRVLNATHVCSTPIRLASMSRPLR